MSVTIKHIPAVSPLFVDKFTATIKVNDNERKEVSDSIHALIDVGHAKRVHKASYYLSAVICPEDIPDLTLLVQCKPKFPTVSFLRIEYNPAVLSPQLIRPYVDYILPGGYNRLVKEGKCTRIDVTVDIKAVNINSLLFWHPGFKKTSLYCGNGGIESLYIGTSESPKRFCVYDKVTEIERKNKFKLVKLQVPSHHITRVEARIKEKDIFIRELSELESPFNNFGISNISLPQSEYDWAPYFLEACRSRGAHDALLMMKNNDVRKVLRKLLGKGTPPWWNPDAVWSEWPSVIAGILAPPPSIFSLELLKHAS